MVGALLGLVSSIIGGAMSSFSHDETQSQLSEMVRKTTVPESVRRGEAILREQANTGLPGYEEQLSEIDSSIPMTLNQAKDYISSGGLVESLSKMYSQSNAAKRELGRANDAAITANKDKLARYLGDVSGKYEYLTEAQKQALQLEGLKEQKASDYDTMAALSSGINSISSATGSLDTQLMDAILGANKNATATPWRTTGDYYGKDSNELLKLSGLNGRSESLPITMSGNTNTIDIINNIIKNLQG